MNIIVCLDDDCGMLFNKRRQSSDIALINRVADLVGDAKLLMNDYSQKLFWDVKLNIEIEENFLLKAKKGDYCFVENVDISDFIDKIDEVVVYRWNRKYPADLKFPISFFESKWQLKSSLEFEGNSHLKIIEEVYVL